jgi:8-oxo-dGTP pyrophosphatase MutT (NUDIX family)
MGDDLIARARRVLADYRPRPAGVEVADARDAAVLVLLADYLGEAHVVLTLRTDTVEHHKGQISFPGGARHGKDEDLALTALRETWEEIGVHPHDVDLIGRLDEIVTVSNFRVAPFVGVLKRTPYPYAPSPVEVAEVLEVPLRHLLDPANKVYEPRVAWGGGSAFSPVYRYHSYRIWGATARMLEGFLDLLERGP